MKNVFLLICIGIALQCLGQKKYSFDYTLAFNVTGSSKKMNTVFYCINSKQNDYVLFIHEKDTVYNTLHFTDQKGLYVESKLKKEDFYKAETLTNTCEQTFRFISLSKEKTKYYSFLNVKDTVISDTTYYHYVLKCNKKLSYLKRKKIPTAHFIVDKNSPNFVPFLYQSMMYEEWKTNPSTIPNGLPKLIYFINYDGTKDSELKLIRAVKIDKYFTVPEACDYTKETIRN